MQINFIVHLWIFLDFGVPMLQVGGACVRSGRAYQFWGVSVLGVNTPGPAYFRDRLGTISNLRFCKNR